MATTRSIAHLDPDIRAAIHRVAERRAVHTENEVKWAYKQPYLQSKGYMLRPRYRPGWQPSWTLPQNQLISPYYFEDYIKLPVWHSDSVGC